MDSGRDRSDPNRSRPKACTTQQSGGKEWRTQVHGGDVRVLPEHAGCGHELWLPGGQHLPVPAVLHAGCAAPPSRVTRCRGAYAWCGPFGLGPAQSCGRGDGPLGSRPILAPPPPTPPFPLPAVYSSLIMPLWAVATNAVTRALEFRATNRWACVGCPGGWGLGERGFKHRGVSCFQVRGPSQQPQQPVFLKKKCGPGGPSRGMCGCLDHFSVRLGYGQAVAAPRRHGGTGVSARSWSTEF